MKTNETTPELIALQDNCAEVSFYLDIDHLSDQQKLEVAGLVQKYCDSVQSTNTYRWFDVLHQYESEFSAIAKADEGLITIEYREASRLFGGLLFSRISELEKQSKDKGAQALVSAAYETLFSSSPNILSYSGTPKDQFKLLALAQATPLARDLADPMVGEIAYAVSFGYPNDIFTDALRAGTAIEQLQAMQVLKRIATWAEWNGEWADPAVDKAESALISTADNTANSMFVRKIAMVNLKELRPQWIDLAELSIEEQTSLLQSHQANKKLNQSNQQRLARRYLMLSQQSGPLVEISKDCAGVWQNDGLTMLEHVREGKHTAALLDVVHGTPELRLSQKQSLLLAELQRPSLRTLVESDLGMALAKLSLTAQVYLLDFMVSAQSTTYDRLGRILNHAPESERPQLCESFLALEHGEEFGDTLLDLAETLQPAELNELLDKLGKIREAAANLGSFVSNAVNPEVGSAVETAIGKRITELLALAQRTAHGQSTPLHDRSSDITAITHYHISEINRVMDVCGQALTQINQSLVDRLDVVGVAAGKDKRGEFSSENHGTRILIRPAATEKGQARINFDTSIADVGKLSIRLDFESGDQMSLDIGSTSNGELNGIVARVTSAAETAFALKRGRTDVTRLNGYHVREAFSHLYISPDDFAHIANSLMYSFKVAA